MWRKHAPAWATAVVSVVIVGLCVAWALLAQVLVPPA